MRSTRFARLAALPLLITAALVTESGLGRRITFNTIDPVATLQDHGRRITLHGPIACTRIEWVALRVTVTQRTTGAIAEGYAIRIGTPTVQPWEVIAAVRGEAAFEEGPVTAVAVAVSRRNGDATDAHQWLVPVMLQRE